MFTSYGSPVDASTLPEYASQSFDAMDVRFLPLWLNAARAADEANHCGEYDGIAQAVGGPSRDDLRAAGLLTRAFTVEFSRTVTISVDVTQYGTATVEAGNPRMAREEWENGNVDDIEWQTVDSYDIRREYNNGNFEESGDNEEIVRVTAVE